MQETMYKEFERIIDDSQVAYRFAETHFDELMHRRVSNVLYGPPAYGPGAACPSRRMIKEKERELKSKTRRKTYKAYYFDSDWDLLYSRTFRDDRLECTMLHFWIGDVNYGRYFLGDTNEFYIPEIFSVKYDGTDPVRFAFVRSRIRVYVEFFCSENDGRIEYNWYDYYPTRKISENGTLLLKEAPFGAENSPVSCGEGFFQPQSVPFPVRRR